MNSQDMDHRAFPPKLRIMATVPRWSIIPLIRPDYVTGHSYFVGVYSRQVAKLVGWRGDYGHLLWEALMHDNDEVFTGDIVGMAKRAIVDDQRHHEYVAAQAKNFMPNMVSGGLTSDEKAIIKVADCMDALFFALGEKLLGNSIIETRIVPCMNALKEAWETLRLCAERNIADSSVFCRFSHFVNFNEIWTEVIQVAIEAHSKPQLWSI